MSEVPQMSNIPGKMARPSRIARVSFLFLAAGLLLVLVVAGCTGGKPLGTEPDSGNQVGKSLAAEVSGSIAVSGSTALQPLVQQAAEDFMGKNPKARIVVTGGGSGTGLSQVVQGQVNIGNSDVFAEEKQGIDASKLKDHRVCVVGFAIVVNPETAVDTLTKEQVIGIFSGNIGNWKEVGGLDTPIVVVNRPESSGTRATFNKYAMDGAEEGEAGITEDSSGAIKKIIAETPGTISYLALSYVDDSVKALKYDGVEPTEENITSGDYPVWSYEHMYTLGEPEGLTASFIQHMLGDEVQKNLVPKLGYISITGMKVSRNP